MTGRVFRPFAWGTLTTDSTMFVSHPPSWKIMPFAQTQMALNHFKPSRNSGFVVFSVSDGVSGCKFTTSTQLEQIPRAYWILLDPMMRYGDIDVSPLFWGSEVGDAWERWTAGRRSLHADPVSWKNGFVWLWDILNEDVMLHIHAHTCTYMGHGSTWMYMDVHGCTWMYMETFQTSCSCTGRRWCQTWEHDMQLARAKTSLLNQKPDVAILWEILRSDDLTNEATFLFQSFNFFSGCSMQKFLPRHVRMDP